MGRSFVDPLPVASVSGRPGVVPRARYLVVDDLGHLVWDRFPWSFCRGFVSISAVDLVSGLDVLLPGSVFLVVVGFGFGLCLLVPLSCEHMVLGLRFWEDSGQFRHDLAIEHELVG